MMIVMKHCIISYWQIMLRWLLWFMQKPCRPLVNIGILSEQICFKVPTCSCSAIVDSSPLIPFTHPGTADSGKSSACAIKCFFAIETFSLEVCHFLFVIVLLMLHCKQQYSKPVLNKTYISIHVEQRQLRRTTQKCTAKWCTPPTPRDILKTAIY